MFWEISWRGITFSYRYVCESGRDRNYLNIIVKKIDIKHRKTTCKVIFTSATKLNKILCNNKSRPMSNSCLEVYKLSSDCREEIHWRNKKNVRSLDQLNIKKIVWQENVKYWIQLNISKIVMGSLIGCIQKALRSYPTCTNTK